MIYDFNCKKCGKKKEYDISVAKYLKLKPPVCCNQEMERVYQVRIDSDGHGGLRGWRT